MSKDFDEAKIRVQAAIKARSGRLDFSFLRIDEGHLEELLDTVARNLPELTDLKISDTDIRELPDALWRLRGLRLLNAGMSAVSHVPSAITKLSSLDSLSLPGTHLLTLPTVLSQLSSVRYLDLDANNFESLPTDSSFPPGLHTLHLGFCHLREVPPGVFELTELRTLDLAHNELTALSSNIRKLRNLTYLRLSRNRLKKLPASLGELSGIHSLPLDGNPLPPELLAAAERGTAELLQYLNALASGGAEITEAKLVLVGEGAVGKSSLLAAFLDEPFVEDRDTTHGIEIKKLDVRHEGSDITLNCWDFGGQPLYRPTHQLFFTKPAVYLVVWKPREGPELGLVEYWISLIKDRAGAGARVHVVATHGGPGQRSAYLDQSRLVARFGEMIVGFHHVDSKTGEGIAELKQKIAATAHGLEHVSRSYPRSWYDVLAELSESRETHLRYDQFQEIAGKHGLTAESARSLARNAHALGQLIYYDDDPALQDLVVLKADWLSVAIGFVLDDPTVQQYGGLLQHRYLPQVWDNPVRTPRQRYSHGLQQMFLRLMERFDLSYRAPELSPDQPLSLVAQLLPGDPPKTLQQQWNDYKPGAEEAIQVCQFVEQDTGKAADPPPGLMARLIVLFHRHSLGRNDINQSVHWQNGLVLEDRYGARALLRTDDTDLTVHVKGVNPSAFLNHLVREIQTYVENFWRGRRTRVLVPCPKNCGIQGVLRGQFDLDTVYRRLDAGKTTAECRGPSCGHDVEIARIIGTQREKQAGNVIDETMSGAFGREILPLLQAHTAEIIRQLNAGLGGVHAHLSDEGSRLFSRIEDRLDVLMRAHDDEANDGPRLFSMDKVRSFSPTTYRMRLTLWCEHSKVPVHLLEPDKPGAGVYTVDVPRDWWVKAAPLVRTTSTLLKAFLPIGLPVIKAELTDDQWKGVEEQLTVIKESLGAAAALGTDAEATRTFEPRAAEGGLLRMLHATLREQDITYADLRKVRAGQRILWVHPRFEHIYNPEPPRIPV
ncbi:COR domain-containing protein [Actinocrispum sp. NPDC049592]|uniref:COR domain-containing protein n=1 Tax=Actinocrispum sp. NPDC049592 TaxID=3154835 RepID=UPI0034382F0E